VLELTRAAGQGCGHRCTEEAQAGPDGVLRRHRAHDADVEEAHTIPQQRSPNVVEVDRLPTRSRGD